MSEAKFSKKCPQHGLEAESNCESDLRQDSDQEYKQVTSNSQEMSILSPVDPMPCKRMIPCTKSARDLK